MSRLSAGRMAGLFTALAVMLVTAGASFAGRAALEPVSAEGSAVDAAEPVPFTVTVGGTENVMDFRVVSGNIVMVPVNEFAALCGYRSSVCDPCGDNELESEDPKQRRKDGLILVKWDRPTAFRSARKGEISLRAPNRRINGVTWTDIELFRKLGCRIKTDIAGRTAAIAVP